MTILFNAISSHPNRRAMIERLRYNYTKLSDLNQPKENVNVWAVVSFITSHPTTDLAMMLVDECETQVFCLLNIDRCESTPADRRTVSLSNCMIVRIHRCGVKRAYNNQITLFGRINYAGLHLAAWCVDDTDCTPMYRTSDGFTFDPQLDTQRLQELRAFWKARNVIDGVARKLFFEMVKNRHQLFSVRHEQPTEDAAVAEHRQHSNDNCSEQSFDHFARNAIGSNADVDTDRRIAQAKTEILEPPDENFLLELRATIRSIVNESPQNNRCICFSKVRQNLYFDMICQVIAVHVPFDGFEGATYLSVCDGTKATIDGTFYSIGTTHAAQSQMFADGAVTDHFRDFVYVIGCWDDYAEKAKHFEAGDIIRILNAKVGAKDAQGLIHIALHGHTPNSWRYKRDIECVRKRPRQQLDDARAEEVDRDGTTAMEEAESDGGGPNGGGKRTRQGEEEEDVEAAAQ